MSRGPLVTSQFRPSALGPVVFGWVLVRWVLVVLVVKQQECVTFPCDLYIFPVVVGLRNDLLSSSVIVAVVSSQLVS